METEAQHDAAVIGCARHHIILEELFAGKPVEEWRALYPGAYDWGPDVGLEIVEE